MSKKINLNGKEYSIENISVAANEKLQLLKFASDSIQEMKNMQALLQRAKNSYIDSLKKEMLSNKAGLSFDE